MKTTLEAKLDGYLATPIASKLAAHARASQEFQTLHTKALDIINCGHDVDGFDLDAALVKLHEDECVQLDIVSNDILELLLSQPTFAQTVLQRALLDVCIYELYDMNLFVE